MERRVGPPAGIAERGREGPTARDGGPAAEVRIRDAAGEWRDEVLLATGREVPAAAVISGCGRRWGMAVSFFASKQRLGWHDPRVRVAASVERAHPLARFVRTPSAVRYAESGPGGPPVERDRPWYTAKAGVRFADVPGALRLRPWEQHVSRQLDGGQTPEELLHSLEHWLAAVR